LLGEKETGYLYIVVIGSDDGVLATVTTTIGDHRPVHRTPTDAIVLCCPPVGPVERCGGPRSRTGAPLARAVRAAVLHRQECP
jgi:hypothetical protein